MFCIRNFLNLKTAIVFILLFNTAFQCKKTESPVIPVISFPQINLKSTPLFLNQVNEAMVEINFTVTAEEMLLILNKVVISFTDDSKTEGISSISANYHGSSLFSTDPLFGSSSGNSGTIVIKGSREMGEGLHFIKLNFSLKSDVNLLTSVKVKEVRLSFSNHDDLVLNPIGSFRFRPAVKLRTAGQDHCDTYRIPGLVTTDRGTLIAVYDNRYNNSKDLQEDIDIGMSRSTDGGQTWEPMKVIMDMGEYGSRSQRLNGCGDPCVLYDPVNHTLWVAALWMSGSAPDQMLWWASKPGMKPEETGQFLLVKSTDDGVTWSQPINITSQIKDPAWQLLLQGPGRGIITKNGILVFPAQFKTDLGTKAIDGGQYTCHSTIVTSKDGGQTWQIGTGAKSNTTEAQVVELADGSLMLNMRDDRNRSDKGDTNGRAVAITTDFGKTWAVHPSSNSALPEPNCMASIIGANLKINSDTRRVLFFSNPNNKNERSNMTVKVSLDNGLTWPEKYFTLLNTEVGFGYSCMTMTGENSIGILYEGVRDLFFQKISVSEILNN
jgi:sialidase-1